MTVTIGGRGSTSAAASSGCSSSASGLVGLASLTVCPISSITTVAVSRSSTWLIVTRLPRPIKVFITSPALTDIFCASSATAIVSGSTTSRIIGCVGFSKACCPDMLVTTAFLETGLMRRRTLRPSATCSSARAGSLASSALRRRSRSLVLGAFFSATGGAGSTALGCSASAIGSVCTEDSSATTGSGAGGAGATSSSFTDTSTLISAVGACSASANTGCSGTSAGVGAGSAGEATSTSARLTKVRLLRTST